jgi:hypothetical protein
MSFWEDLSEVKQTDADRAEDIRQDGNDLVVYELAAVWHEIRKVIKDTHIPDEATWLHWGRLVIVEGFGLHQYWEVDLLPAISAGKAAFLERKEFWENPDRLFYRNYRLISLEQARELYFKK